MPLAAATRLGAYEVLALIGAGGMGEVYKARDTRLERIVALKVLPPGVASDPASRARFEREAKAIAALTHPHICTIHDVGRHDAIDYLVMEYVDGVTLATRLGRGPLPTPDVLRYAIEIADALDTAHRSGVVHRDLKPSNVMVTSAGHAKVMDFGVAKRVTPVGVDPTAVATVTVTAPAELAGTLSYMSPEQLRGVPVDPRSDIFSFGVLLHEMLTGTHPFLRSSSITTIDAILNAPAPALARSANDAPPLLAHIVSRCLAKDREQRYQSFRDVQIELSALCGDPASTGQAVAVPPGTTARSSIARVVLRRRWLAPATVAVVLAASMLAARYWPASMPFTQRALAFKERDWILISDFENLTGDNVFDRSLRTALEAGISQSQFVNVFPAVRVDDALKRMQKPAARLDDAVASEVAIREGIRAVLSCSIAQVGDVYSITIRLIDPRSRAAVHTEGTRAKGKDQVLPALDVLANTVRRDLGESLASVSQQNLPLPKATTSSLEALKLYADSLQSRTDSADELLRQAIALDPDFALARAELGRRYYLKSERAARLQGEAEFVRALGLLERLTTKERLWITALAEDSRGHRESAVEAYKSYLTQHPDDAAAWYRIGWTQMAGLGQLEPAVSAFSRALAINASDAGARINLATCYAGLDRRREAVVEYQRAFSLRPDYLTAEYVNHEYGFTLVHVGEIDKATDVFRTMIAHQEQWRQARGRRSLALLQMYQGHYSASIDELRKAILINHVGDAAVSELRDRVFLARALEAKGNTQSSVVELAAAEAIIARSSMGPEWLVGAAKMRARSGRIQQAKQLLSLMMKTAQNATTDSSANRNTSRDQADLDVVRGEIALAEHNTDEAVKLFESARLIEPRVADILESLAVALVAAGRLEDAAGRYEELLSMRPLGGEGQETWVRAHVKIGEVYERLGRADAARASYERLVALWKDGDADLIALNEAKTRLARLKARP